MDETSVVPNVGGQQRAARGGLTSTPTVLHLIGSLDPGATEHQIGRAHV